MEICAQRKKIVRTNNTEPGATDPFTAYDGEEKYVQTDTSRNNCSDLSYSYDLLPYATVKIFRPHSFIVKPFSPYCEDPGTF